jgi:hypothetical protein
MSPAIPAEMVEVHRKDKPLLSRDQAEQMSAWMAKAIISRLAEDLDDLNATAPFRAGFQRCCAKMLMLSSTRAERVLFFHEAIPGFTVMVVKREGWELDTNAPVRARRSTVRRPTQETEAPPAAEDWEHARTQVVEQVVNAFVQRTGNRVLSIEAEDVVVVLFPAADLKKNLQDMGFWFD